MVSPTAPVTTVVRSRHEGMDLAEMARQLKGQPIYGTSANAPFFGQQAVNYCNAPSGSLTFTAADLNG